MEIHEEFTKWAEGQGVEITGIKPHKFEGRGLGIISTKRLEANTTILNVPLSALRTAQTVPRTITTALPSITVHGLLATDLALDTCSFHAPWRRVLPSFPSFQNSMPLCWAPSLQSLLPSESQSLLARQKEKFALDWSMVTKAFPELKYEEYLYAWLLVNTRTFYYVDPRHRGKKMMNRDDCLALNPFADYFNHTSPPHLSTPANPISNTTSPTPCTVIFTRHGYRISTSIPVEPETELFISYGAHSNSFLLTEYGFIMSEDTNSADFVVLDEWVLRRGGIKEGDEKGGEKGRGRKEMGLFTNAQLELLEEHHFLGNYILDGNTSTLCYRTLTALHLLYTTPRQWIRMVERGDEGVEYQDAVNTLLHKIFSKMITNANTKLAAIDTLGEQEMLRGRWRQILRILERGILNLNIAT